jgi:transcriptional regulator with PAS, ATPase and Fis domain
MLSISAEGLSWATSYNWPGNIRGLQNGVEREVILSETDTFFVDESWLKLESAELSPSARRTFDVVGS